MTALGGEAGSSSSLLPTTIQSSAPCATCYEYLVPKRTWLCSATKKRTYVRDIWPSPFSGGHTQAPKASLLSTHRRSSGELIPPPSCRFIQPCPAPPFPHSIRRGPPHGPGICAAKSSRRTTRAIADPRSIPTRGQRGRRGRQLRPVQRRVQRRTDADRGACP